MLRERVAGRFAIRFERWNGEMSRHDGTYAGRDGGAEGNEFRSLQFSAIAQELWRARDASPR